LRRTALTLIVVFFGFHLHAYPLQPDGLCGSTRTCRAVIDAWNDASWNALVDDTIQSSGTPLAAVRWYSTEGSCTGTSCNDQLHTICGKTSNAATHQFPGVTDELSNVLLNHAMGSNQTRYEKLRNFTELLRHPDINNLQCWKYYIDGQQSYTSASQVCEATDSASDASIRILGAYGIACAKQRAGVWDTTGHPNYCADYVTQGNAIWGRGTASHGEIKHLANGEAYLANGYNNQGSAPTNWQAFRPDYYELQFLMDFAIYEGHAGLRRDVLDMLADYVVSAGANAIHRGKTGSFNSDTSSHTCGELCSPAYMDNIDTWRAIPALGNLIAVHPTLVPAETKDDLFDRWWDEYGGGHSSYAATSAKPFEIYSDETTAVKQTEESYKTAAMWLPLGVAYSASYTSAAAAHLVDTKYDWTNHRFYGAAYYGGYYSQFAQRAIGVATGLIDPRTYGLEAPSQVSATVIAGEVQVQWLGVSGATSYEIVRSTGGAFSTVGTVSVTSFTDATVTSSNAYVYRVRAIGSSGTSQFSAIALATTASFTDDPLSAGTNVKGVHFTELRDAIGVIRGAARLSTFPFTDGTLASGMLIRLAHRDELRTALEAALDVLGADAPSWSGDSIVRATDVSEIRDAIR
jgi:hypothetical protein